MNLGRHPDPGGGRSLRGRGLPGWATTLPGGSFGAAPTAYDGAVYVSGSADVGGALIWHRNPDCYGGGASTTVIHGGSVYARGNMVGAPVVDGAVVYEGSTSGRVYGVSATSGHQVWSGKEGSEILGLDEQNAAARIGLAVGGGLLVVPEGPALTAYGD